MLLPCSSLSRRLTGPKAKNPKVAQAAGTTEAAELRRELAALRQARDHLLDRLGVAQHDGIGIDPKQVRRRR